MSLSKKINGLESKLTRNNCLALLVFVILIAGFLLIMKEEDEYCTQMPIDKFNALHPEWSDKQCNPVTGSKKNKFGCLGYKSYLARCVK